MADQDEREIAKVWIFSLERCPFCLRAKERLKEKGVWRWEEINLSRDERWRSILFLFVRKTSVPQIFANGYHIGGESELQHLIEKKEKDFQQIFFSTTFPEHLKMNRIFIDFPLKLEVPKPSQFLSLFPPSLLSLWDDKLESLHSSLGYSSEDPISSLLIMLSSPSHMIVVCTSGPGKEIYRKGEGGEKRKIIGEKKKEKREEKGEEKEEEKEEEKGEALFCQIAIERGETVFFDGPENFPSSIEKNEDFVKFGYGFYIGASWDYDQIQGTVAVMETKPNRLNKNMIPIVEQFRDSLEQDLKNCFEEQEVKKE